MQIATLIAIVLQYLKYRSYFPSYAPHLLRIVRAAIAENTQTSEQGTVLIALENELSTPCPPNTSFPESSAR